MIPQGKLTFTGVIVVLIGWLLGKAGVEADLAQIQSTVSDLTIWGGAAMTAWGRYRARTKIGGGLLQ